MISKFEEPSGQSHLAGSAKPARNTKPAGPAKAVTNAQARASRQRAEPLTQEMVDQWTRLFKLLADETRMRILLHLMQQGELHVRALCELLQQSQPAVSHHLAQLRMAELIACRRAGKHNYYSVVPRQFQAHFDRVLALLGQQNRPACVESDRLLSAGH